jgi:hypothetical protein
MGEEEGEEEETSDPSVILAMACLSDAIRVQFCRHSLVRPVAPIIRRYHLTATLILDFKLSPCS